MKKIFQYVVLLCSVLLISSCEDVVQIKLDEGSKLYVIDAFLNDLPGKQIVHITTNDTYFSNREAPPVGDADVKLKNLSAGKEFAFINAGNGNYVFINDSITSIGAVGNQFELIVTINGVVYTSLVIQKRGAILDSIVPALPEELGSFGPPSTIPFYYCVLFAKDRTDPLTDYYWIKTFRNDTSLFSSSDINICTDGTGGPVTSAEKDSLDFSAPAIYLGFAQFKSGNSCEVQIHSITKETFYFFGQAAAQINNGGLFATTPENVRTNIVTPSGATTKAIGWFNMATVARQKIVVP